MNRILALLTAVVLIFALTACGAGATSAVTSSQPEGAASTPEPADAAPLYASQPDGDPKEHTTAAIQERGKLIVALVDTGAPYTFQNDDGTLIGMDAAMANTLAQDMQVELELLLCTAQDAVDAVRSGAADVAIGAFDAEASGLSKVAQTAPYAGGAATLLLCVEDVKTFPTAQAFSTKTVAYLRTVPAFSEAAKSTLGKNVQLKAVKSAESGIKQLRSGSVSAVVMDSFLAQAYAADNPDLALSSVALDSEKSAPTKVMAVMKGNDDLLGYANTEIDTYTKSCGLGRLMISALTKADNLGLDVYGGTTKKGADSTAE